MTGTEIVTLVGILLAAIVLFFALRRYAKLRVKINIPFGHKNISGEMAGEELLNRPLQRGGPSPRVRTNIKGDVKSSDVVTAGGSIGAATEKTIGADADVSTGIEGSVQDSRISTAAKDVLSVKQNDQAASSKPKKG
jgi:hypothetical protein